MPDKIQCRSSRIQMLNFYRDNETFDNAINGIRYFRIREGRYISPGGFARGESRARGKRPTSASVHDNRVQIPRTAGKKKTFTDVEQPYIVCIYVCAEKRSRVVWSR